MARLNIPNESLRTHEGAKAKHITTEQMLRRTVCSCMLWEKEFYEDGESIASRIESLVPVVAPIKVAELAVEARTKYKLRHVPLLLVREMARVDTHKSLVARTLAAVIQRPDELAEFVAIYWKNGKQSLSSQVKKGLALAFTKFNEYQLAKYNRDGAIKLRDVLFMCHAKPVNRDQEVLWKKLADSKLDIPDTWEVSLSAGKDKRETFERLITERKLGGLALLRNLRNMDEANVDRQLTIKALREINSDRILPFRFISAAKYRPDIETHIEEAMLRCLNGMEKLSGMTIVLIDKSGSMDDRISDKSDLLRYDAACGLAILVREVCQDCLITTFNQYEGVQNVPARHGFALRDALGSPRGGTPLGAAVRTTFNTPHDRLIVITDEQSQDSVPDPIKEKSYMINVASYDRGVGYGKWIHVDGWSEAVIDFIREYEKL